jgi:hypothetical protein
MAEPGRTFGVAPLETMKVDERSRVPAPNADGRLPAPPIAATLGFRLAEVARGLSALRDDA